jgi:hypothetical protein
MMSAGPDSGERLAGAMALFGPHCGGLRGFEMR